MDVWCVWAIKLKEVIRKIKGIGCSFYGFSSVIGWWLGPSSEGPFRDGGFIRLNDPITVMFQLSCLRFDQERYWVMQCFEGWSPSWSIMLAFGATILRICPYWGRCLPRHRLSSTGSASPPTALTNFEGLRDPLYLYDDISAGIISIVCWFWSYRSLSTFLPPWWRLTTSLCSRLKVGFPS